jgi:hypothetical protein
VAGWNAQRFLDWAATVGPQTQAAIEQVLAARVHPQPGYRTALGILRLGKTPGEERLEAACLRAIQIKAVTYRSIASILKHALRASDAHPGPGPSAPRPRPCARLPVLPLTGPTMLNHPTYERLTQRRLTGMARALAEQAQTPTSRP